jgi:bifunctional non-homologous end joining protein LigD
LIKLKNPDKLFWPKQKILKKDLFDYYDQISFKILKYLKNRPAIFKRCPNGVEKECWIQQDAPKNLPKFIKTFKHQTKSDPHSINHVLINSKNSLLWLISQGIIEIHIWNNKYNSKIPNWIVFDVDREGESLEKMKKTIFLIKEELENQKYKPFLKTTGLSGLHILIQNQKKLNYRQVREFVKNVLNKIDPDRKIITAETKKEKRGNCIYIDPAQNSYGRSIIAPYSVRASEPFSVSLPLNWEEFKKFKYQSMNIKKYISKIKKVKNWL